MGKQQDFWPLKYEISTAQINSIQFLFLPFFHAYIYKVHIMQARQ
jgi:hypothetical protein